MPAAAPVIPPITIDGANTPPLPPELIVNAAYRLSGKKFWISEPTRTEPMRPVPPAGMTWLWLLCVLGLPAAVLAAGGAVLYARSR